MSQELVYWVEDDGNSTLSDEEWVSIDALQRQTNLREYLCRGRVGFVRWTYEPRWPALYADSALPESLGGEAVDRHLETLVERGWTWEELVRCRLAVRAPGGVHDSTFLMAGRSEVSDLRGDLRAVLQFLVRASAIAPACLIHVSVDGDLPVPELQIRNREVRPDPEGLLDRLSILWSTGEADAAADLLEAVESGVHLAGITDSVASEG